MNHVGSFASLFGMGAPSLRQDERDWFERISDGKTVLWMCGSTTYLWHATTDGKVAVCSSRITIDRERDPYPRTDNRAHDTMTCDRCAELVRKVPIKPASVSLVR